MMNFLLMLIATYSLIYIDTSQAASSNQNKPTKYEPIYVTVRTASYRLLGGLDYDQEEDEFFFQAPGHTIGVACPMKNHNRNALVVVEQATNEIVNYDFQCDYPVKSVVLRGISEEEFGIGYLIYKIRRDPRLILLYRDIPQRLYPVKQIAIQFRILDSRVLSVSHFINSNKFSEKVPESTSSSNINSDYKKNIDIFGYDPDDLYDKENQNQRYIDAFDRQPSSFLMKLHLAPAEDFMLHNHKMATRASINSTPVWVQFAIKWHELEVYIRKVARILKFLLIRTGTANHPDTPENPLFYLHPDGDKLPVCKYLWKTVVFKQYLDKDKEADRVGILFVMHNDLENIEDQQPICEDVSQPLGWVFLSDDLPFDSKHLIYGCSLSHENMAKLGATLEGQYHDFNLHSVLAAKEDVHRKIKLVDIDVYSLVQKLPK